MNYVCMMGGLGNQFFQYAFSKYIEKISGQETRLHLDFFDYVEKMNGITDRAFELEKYKAVFISQSGNVRVSKIVDENEAIDQLDFNNGDLYFRGYWQNKRYFEAVKDEVHERLILKKEYISDEMKCLADDMHLTESVSIHVRHGDYLKEDNKNLFSQLSLSYYENALETITDYIGSAVTKSL